jgi:hypothetical protein
LYQKKVQTKVQEKVEKLLGKSQMAVSVSLEDELKDISL